MTARLGLNLKRVPPGADVVISGETWNTVAGLLEEIPRIQFELQALKKSQKGKHIDSFLARITGNAALPGETNRWKYAWSEVLIDGDDSAIKTDGRSGTTATDYALHLIEDANDGTGVQATGVDIDGTDYPAGFSMKPIQGNPVVRMFVFRNKAGDGLVHAFTAGGNKHDGTC